MRRKQNRGRINHRPSKRTPKIRKIFGDDIGAGAILLCDIIDYSKLPAQIQAVAVSHLLNFLCSDPLLKPNQSRIINGTGDGALICWPQVTRKISCPEVVEFSERIISHMLSTPGKRIELRIGIHIGQYRSVFPPSKSVSFQVTGTGLNECARISSIGDAGNVVVSEDFLDHWKKSMQSESLAMARFYPSGDTPITVFVKHNQPIKVRLYFHGPVARKLPIKFLAIRGIKQKISTMLARIEKEFIKGLLKHPERQSVSAAVKNVQEEADLPDTLARAVSMRVTVFLLAEEDSKSPRLVPTEHRYHRDPAWCYQSQVEYVVKQERPEGPMAHAVISARPYVLHALPIPRSSRNQAGPSELTPEYVDQLEREGISRDKVSAMKRLPRALIGFPIITHFPNDPLTNERRSINWGAVCMDMDDPLSDFSREELLAISEAVYVEFGTPLADMFAMA